MNDRLNRSTECVFEDRTSAASHDGPLSRRSVLHGFVVAGAALATVSLSIGRNAAAQPATPAVGACSAATPSAATGSPSSECVALGTFDIYYSPNLVTIPADKPVTVQVKNNGVTLHNFSVTDHKNSGVKNLDISLDIAPGETKSVAIEAPVGDYYFYCNVPGHEQAGMFGYIQAKADAEIKAETATVTPPAGS